MRFQNVRLPTTGRLLAFLVLLASFAFQLGRLRADEPADVTRRATGSSFSLPDQVPAKEGVAELKSGAKLWYWDTGGKGEAVVLLHAATMSGAAWPYQQPVFARAGYRVIGYSRRGHFKSPNESRDFGYASQDLLELLDHLRVEKAHVVAAAQGGSFAVDFALSYPERVQSLTLMSSLMGIDEPDYHAMLRRLLPPFFSNLPADFKELSPSYRASNPAGVQAWIKLAQQARLRGIWGAAKRKNRVTWQRLREIETPVLLVGGEADLYAPPPLLRLQAKNMPTSQLALIPEVGHSANWEAPTTFNKILLKFIQPK